MSDVLLTRIHLHIATKFFWFIAHILLNVELIIEFLYKNHRIVDEEDSN